MLKNMINRKSEEKNNIFLALHHRKTCDKLKNCIYGLLLRQVPWVKGGGADETSLCGIHQRVRVM